LKSTAYRVSRTERPVVALVAALFVVFHALVLSFSIGAVADGRVSCAASPVSSTGSSAPLAPAVHQFGACCVLHGDVWAGDEVQRIAFVTRSVEISQPPPQVACLAGSISEDPKLNPISPRAPPARSV